MTFEEYAQKHLGDAGLSFEEMELVGLGWAAHRDHGSSPEIPDSSIAREGALDRTLSGQGERDRLIDSVAALILGQAFELRLSHTINGEWPEGEAGVKAEHDMMLQMAGDLRGLKSNQQGILDSSGDHEYSQGICGDGAAILKDGQAMTPEQIIEELRAAQNHIADVSNMATGNAVAMGDTADAYGAMYGRSMIIQFETDDDIRAAIQSGRCRFTVFGGEV